MEIQKVDVWDTYVKKEDNKIMHFDIIVPSGTPKSKVFEFGNQYLKSKNIDSKIETSKCDFCHSETIQPEWLKAIKEKGYFIYEMEGC
jgi:hypothetical protein